jgi:hypothetical protein
MTLFERYCALHGHQPYGATNETVARFVADIAPMGIEQVWEALREVSRSHYVHNLFDPTLGETVAAALNNIAKVDPPRSWPKDLHERFKMLPHEIQHWLARRQAADDRLIRNLQNELAQLRKKENADGVQVSSTAVERDAAAA